MREYTIYAGSEFYVTNRRTVVRYLRRKPLEDSEIGAENGHR